MHQIFLLIYYILFSFSGIAVTFFPSNVSELISNIATSQANLENDTIDLGGKTFILTEINNTDAGLGPNGLPYIKEANFNLTIKNGVLIRDESAPKFRFILNSSSLSLDGVTFKNGYTERGTSGATRGGAIFNLKDMPLINNCQFINNKVEGNSAGSIWKEALGGAISNYKGKIGIISNSLFENNIVIGGTSNAKVSGLALGGAISIEYSASIDTISFTNFINNQAIGSKSDTLDAVAGKAFGGAIGVYYGSAINSISSIRNTNFTNNQAFGGNALIAEQAKFAGVAFGGAIGFFASNSGLNNITNTNFISNNAIAGKANNFSTDAFGGAVYLCANSRLNRIASSKFIQNKAQGLSNLPEISGRSFGGALAFEGVQLGSITSTTFDNNQAVADDIAKGGAIYMVSSNNTPSIIYSNTDSTYSNNQAAIGGAIYIEGNNTISSFLSYLNNTTFSGNFSNYFGAAIFLGNNSYISDLGNSTIANNHALADKGGAGIYLQSGSYIKNLISNIIATNKDGATDDYEDINMEENSFIYNSSYNLIGVDTGHNIVNAISNNQVGTALINLDPLLDILQNNGGETFTHALLPNSTAINTGNNFYNTKFDQRAKGYLRVINNQADIGAFESSI